MNDSNRTFYLSDDFFGQNFDKIIYLAIKLNTNNIEDILFEDKKLFHNFLSVKNIDINQLQYIVNNYLFKNDLVKIDVNISFFN